eukprot:g2909.t1
MTTRGVTLCGRSSVLGRQEQLQKLCSKEGKEDYQAYTAESYTYAELLQKYPSCKVSLGHLLDYVPDIKPRLYSIASSSRLRGEDVCHLCIIKNESLTGLSTRWLSEDLHPEASGAIGVRACVHPSAVTLPEKHSTPMVMVALGTGIAPMRAFIEERAAAKKDGEDRPFLVVTSSLGSTCLLDDTALLDTKMQ